MLETHYYEGLNCTKFVCDGAQWHMFDRWDLGSIGASECCPLVLIIISINKRERLSYLSYKSLCTYTLESLWHNSNVIAIKYTLQVLGLQVPTNTLALYS